MTTHLLGWGTAFPPHEYTNAELGDLVGLRDGKSARYGDMLGIECRRSVFDFRSKRQTTSCDQLGSEAARAAIEHAGVDVRQIDTIITASSCFDYLFPSLSSRILKALELPSARTFDLMGGCAEFIHGVAIADTMIATGRARCVLVVAAEVVTMLHAQVRFPVEYFLFGDAGAAVVLTAGDGRFELVDSWVDTRTHFDGDLLEPVVAPLLRNDVPPPFLRSGVSSPHIRSEVPVERRLLHDGRVAMRIAAPLMAEAVRQVLNARGIASADYFLVPHQPSAPILAAVERMLELPPEQIGISSRRRGNMATASVPVTFVDHYERIEDYPYNVWASVGAGVSIGSLLWRRIAQKADDRARHPSGKETRP